MTQPTDYLQWSKKCPPGGYTIMQIVPDPTTAEPVILVECHAPTEPPPAPLINGTHSRRRPRMGRRTKRLGPRKRQTWSPYHELPSSPCVHRPSPSS